MNLILAILGVIHMWVSCSADDTNRCLCLSATKSVPGADRSTECTATDPRQENEPEGEKSKTQLESTDFTETADIIETTESTESVDDASGPEVKKKTSKMLKSTTEKMYLEMCDELRGQLGMETNSDCEHKYGHCCFCGGEDGGTSSQQSEDEAGGLDEGLRQAKLLQRDIRVSLFEAGILESVGPWLACTDNTIKVRPLSHFTALLLSCSLSLALSLMLCLDLFSLSLSLSLSLALSLMLCLSSLFLSLSFSHPLSHALSLFSLSLSLALSLHPAVSHSPYSPSLSISPHSHSLPLLPFPLPLSFLSHYISLSISLLLSPLISLHPPFQDFISFLYKYINICHRSKEENEHRLLTFVSI